MTPVPHTVCALVSAVVTTPLLIGASLKADI